MRPARAALTRPARGASFRLIVTVSHVSMGGHNYRTVREDISIDHQEAIPQALDSRPPTCEALGREPHALGCDLDVVGAPPLRGGPADQRTHEHLNARSEPPPRAALLLRRPRADRLLDEGRWAP